MIKKKIGIIGFGTMGSAIAQRIKFKYEVLVFDKDAQKVSEASGMRVSVSIADLTRDADVVLLAVKPQDFSPVLQECRPFAKMRLFISIAAGITTRFIEGILGDVKVVRAMPNLGAILGVSETSLCPGSQAGDEDLFQAQELFDYIGKSWILEERLMNAATAICGSGPAYIFYDMEKSGIGPKGLPITDETIMRYVHSLKVAAESLGFDKEVAMEFAVATVGTSVKLATETGLTPAELRARVTSKGGTTEAAVKVLSDRGSWSEAAEAALLRAIELSKTSTY
jgi:pyrroline-5-carboxylate reductase